MRIMKEEKPQIRRTGRQYRKRHFNWRRLIASLLIVVGIILLIGVLNYNSIQSWLGSNNQSSVINVHGKNRQKPNYDYKKVKPISAASLADAYRKRSNYRAIGQIAIPMLDINLNIYQGVGNTELNLGVGTMKPKQKMGQGNYCLAGHNMDDNKTFFSPLYTAKSKKQNLKGLIIMLMNYKRVYYYTISKAKFVPANAVWLLNDNGHRLVSLFTCDYTGRGRLFVQGKYQKSERLVDAPKKVRDAFKRN